MNNDTIREKFKSLALALKLQAKEYKRRLKDLNGEAKRIRDIQAEYVPREVFENTIKDLRQQIDVIRDWKIAEQGKSSWAKYIPILISLVGLLLALAAYFKK